MARSTDVELVEKIRLELAIQHNILPLQYNKQAILEI